MQGLYAQISETHGIALQHCITPQRLPHIKSMLASFGALSSYDVYQLTHQQFLSVAHFAEAQSCQICYHALRSFIDSQRSGFTTCQQTSPLIDVGWVNEQNNSKLSSKSYVKARHALWQVQQKPSSLQQQSSSTQLSSHTHQRQQSALAFASRSTQNGYLIAFWSRLSTNERKEVCTIASQYAIETFQDELEGGRYFMRFSDEATADKVWDLLVQNTGITPSLLSYSTLQEFVLTKR